MACCNTCPPPPKEVAGSKGRRFRRRCLGRCCSGVVGQTTRPFPSWTLQAHCHHRQFEESLGVRLSRGRNTRTGLLIDKIDITKAVHPTDFDVADVAASSFARPAIARRRLVGEHRTSVMCLAIRRCTKLHRAQKLHRLALHRAQKQRRLSQGSAPSPGDSLFVESA